MRTRLWWLAAALLALGACDSPMTPDGGAMSDGGDMQGDASDACAGLDLCTTAGTTCSGDSVVSCAENADGCLVETETACGADQVCDDSGATAMCVDVDPCDAIPAEDACETEGERVCDGDTLEECTMNVDGCLVLERMDCGAEAGGACDASGTMPMCVTPPDPCAEIPEALRCDAEGTSCAGTGLVTCAPNAFGCLVKSTDDCAARAGGTCEGTPAACVFTGDACEGITQCAAEGVTCDGPELVECAPDAYGCLVETRTTCTDEMFGFCDAEAAMPMCSTAATDPCMGETECGTEVTRACNTDNTAVESCSPNAFGCFVAATTTCETGDVCSDADGAAMCVDQCSLIPTCPSDTYCDGDDVVTCAPDANGCLVESSRSTCPSTETCDPATTMCDPCPSAEPTVLNCASGTVNGDTAMGDATISDYECTTYDYPSNEQVWAFQNADRMYVTITAVRGASSDDFDLYVLDGTSAACGAAASCLDSSTGTTDTEEVEFIAEAGVTNYLAYDKYDSAGTTDYTLTVACAPLVCGDGMAVGPEACDDGNTATGDGCSDTCTIEAGYDCPAGGGACSPLCGNAELDSGEDCDDGGATAPGCSDTCTVETGYFCSGEPSVCEVMICGDGAVTGDEECDDGNAAAGDGCSDTCAYEAGFACSDTDVCSALTAHNTCATAFPIGATTTVTGDDVADGGAPPTATDCGGGSGMNALYYEVTVPARTLVDVQTDPSIDIVLFTLDACDAAACSDATDSSPEETRLVNTGTSTITRIVGVRPYFDSTTSGTVDIDFTYTPLLANTTCAAATPITTSTTLSAQDTLGAGTPPSGTVCASSTAPTLYYAITVPAGQVGLVDVDGASGFDAVIMELDSCGAADCSARTDEDSSGGTEMIVIDNRAGGADLTRIVAINEYTDDETGAFELDVSIGPAPSNWMCDTATAITATTTLADVQLAGGGPAPADASCGNGSGNVTLFYAVTVPAGGSVDVQTAPDFDIVLFAQNACSDTTCTDSTDSFPESLTLTNAGTTDAVQFVGVRPYYGEVLGGTFDITFTYPAP